MTLEVSKPEGFVGQLLLGPMSIHQRVVFGRWVVMLDGTAAIAAASAVEAVGQHACRMTCGQGSRGLVHLASSVNWELQPACGLLLLKVA